MTSIWEYKKIEDIAEKVGMGPFGSSIKVETFVPDGIPVISGQHLHGFRLEEDAGFNFVSEEHADRLRNSNVYRGDIILTHAGNIGNVAYIPENSRYERYVASQRQFYMRCNVKKVLPSFVTYFFKTYEGQHRLKANSSSVGVPSIAQPVSYLRKLEIPVPPLNEQYAIVDVLGALDDKIELNRRMNTTLESMARAVFRRWFVEGEEVGNWEIGRLGDFIKVNERSVTKDYSHDEIEYIDISSVSLGHLEGTTTYSLTDSPSRAKRLVQHGDTIWSTVRPNRKSYLFISNPKENLVVSTGFAVLTPKKVPPSFLYFLTTTEQFVDYLVSNADGSAYPAVLPERFADAEFSIPPESVLDKFESIASPMLVHIAHNEKESRTLASLRDTLLPKLMRGEVRVKDMEKII